jgi:hypothetical protein
VDSRRVGRSGLVGLVATMAQRADSLSAALGDSFLSFTSLLVVL